jgi:peptidoglycan/xylan/chitin deacetylase (PgdA/CDA1 family)
MKLFARIGNKLKAFLKRAPYGAVVVGILASIIIVSMPAPSAHALTTPKISFTFDDGFESFITRAAPTLAAHGLTGTAYVTTNFVGTTNFLTWDQVVSLQNDHGWEVGNHTLDHAELPTVSATEQERQMRDGKAALVAHGIDVDSFAAPYGAYDDTTLALSAQYHTSLRGFWDEGYNTYPSTSHLLMNQQVQIGDGDENKSVSVAQAKQYIDQAIANNKWLILTFHDITATQITPSNEDEAYTYPQADLDAIAAYAQAKIAANQLDDIRVRDGMFTAPPADTTPPVISGPTANATQTAATIGWTTNEASTSQVEYGTTTAYGNQTPLDSTLVTSHGVTLTNLTAGTDYHYRVTSKDAAGNTATATGSVRTAAEDTPPEEPQDRLEVGEQLTVGQQLTSSNGQYRLIMQGDGNLVVYDALNKPLWSASSNGKGGSRVVMQGDGNLVIYRSDNTPVWHTQTNGSGANKAVMQDDGNFVLYQGTKAMWSSKGGLIYSVLGASTQVSDRLIPGQQLSVGQSLYSRDGRYRLVLQGDGNLVIYSPRNRAIWSTKTNGKGGNRLVLQTDGNLVLYAGNKPLWSSKTSRKAVSSLVMQSDGNLVLYDTHSRPLWASHTSGRL